ncbi:hypothetical protein [Luteolibacter soli]|uniref:Uncharacterized protein n=1 Tax=Luteolibacter soli TaxID=3135280 RepID=A0ABU9AVQ5_9BACT
MEAMEDKEPTDFYRIAFYCGLLVVAWAIQVTSLRQFFWVSQRTNPPQFLVVDFNQSPLFLNEDPHKPVAQILAEKGLKADARLVSQEGAEKLLRDHQIKRWSPLAVALAGALVASWFAWLLSGSWQVVIAAIIFAPWALYLMRERDWRREL